MSPCMMDNILNYIDFAKPHNKIIFGFDEIPIDGVFMRL